MDRSQKVSVFIAAAILLAGLIAGWKYDPLHFSRSGSLLVVVAVLFATFGIKPKLDSAYARVLGLMIQESPKVLQMAREEAKTEAQIQEVYSQTIVEVLEDSRKLIDQKTREAVKTEVLILVIGTLVWGYGDLLFAII